MSTPNATAASKLLLAASLALLLQGAASAAGAAAPAAQPACGAGRVCAQRVDGPQKWGQADAAVVRNVYKKVVEGARNEKFAKENQGWFSKLLGQDPEIEAKVDLAEKYLPDDSPAVAAKDPTGAPLVRVGRSALDACQGEGELAFVLGHELHHTLARERKQECLTRGLKAAGSFAKLKTTGEFKDYRRALEREADAWGQRYAKNAGFSALDAIGAVQHIKDLGKKLDAVMPEDEHESFAERQLRLQNYGAAPFEATCPWQE